MPWTALGFLIGAVAICGLPPLNGFVSELPMTMMPMFSIALILCEYARKFPCLAKKRGRSSF
jgi:formate hydrogenlyase subunit 3/multisubunit Na+/H+ antiporter MnhD subunit